MTYNEILSTILDSVEGKNGEEFENALLSAITNLGLTSDELQKVKEVFGLLDKIPERVQELFDARHEGTSRSVFVAKEMDSITSDMTDADRSIILDSILSDKRLNEE